MFSKPVPKKLPEPALPRSNSTQNESFETGRVKSKRESAECRAFQKCFVVLADGIVDPGRLAIQLYSRELIGPDIRTEAQKQVVEERVKIEKLLSPVEKQILVSPATKFREFLDVFFRASHHYSTWQQGWRILIVSCQDSAQPVCHHRCPPRSSHHSVPHVPLYCPYHAPINSTHHPAPVYLSHQRNILKWQCLTIPAFHETYHAIA